MSFVNPGLLLWLAPLAGIILGLYLLKMRRRDLRVPATFLWPKHVEEIRANSLFQKLRFSWLLILQLLAAALLCMALTGPQIIHKGLAGSTTVIVIDSSMTMGSTDVKPSRLEVAKAKARDIVNGVLPGQRIAIIEAGSEPMIVSPLTHDPPAELRAIDSVSQSDATPTVGEALRIAAAIIGNDPSGRIILLSDGTFGPVENFALAQGPTHSAAGLTFEAIGHSDNNLAMSALGVSEARQGRAVYCAVKNMGSTPAKAVVNLYGDGVSIHSESVDLPAHGDWSTVVQAPASASLFRANIEGDDVLVADNSMAVSAEKGASLRVLLVTNDDPFTEKALSLDPRVVLDRSDKVPQSELSSQTAKYDVIVFDGVAETPVANPAVLVLGSAASDSEVRVSGVDAKPTFKSQKPDPLLTAVDLSQVATSSAQRLEAVNADVVATGSSGPEVLTVSGAQRRVYLSFQPLKSDLPLQPAYPIFIANSLSFLVPTSVHGPLVVRPGRPFTVPATKASLVDDGGHSFTVSIRDGIATVQGLDRVGHYLLTVDGKPRDVYCSRDGNPVDVKPVPQLTAGGTPARSTTAGLSALDVWRYAALLLLTVLVGEWMLYARQS